MPNREEAVVIKSDRLANGVYELVLATDKIAAEARPGQFVSVYSKDGARLLPRPISVCEAYQDRLRLVYRIAGAGTLEFSKLAAGDTVTVQGALGNGYDVNAPYAKKKCVIFGGGIGIPPMLELAKRLSCEKTVVLGYRDSETFLRDDFQKYADVYVATEDGSVGAKGNVLDAVKQYGISGGVFYACGPTMMLRAVKAYANEVNAECYVSLEERMACGIGACLACVCKTKGTDEHSKVKNTRICKEGPVFDAREVEF